MFMVSAQLTRTGRQTIVLQTEIRDDDGKLVAFVTQTQAVLQNGR